MALALEGICHHDLQAWLDLRLLRSSVAQSHAYNSAARTQLKHIKHETVLALWEADKRLYTLAKVGALSA